MNASQSSVQYFSNYTGQDRGRIISQLPSDSKRLSRSKNIGDRMHQQAQTLKENKERLVEHYRNEADLKFQEGHSFKP